MPLKLKNPGAPGGRKDWKGRTPSTRFRFTLAQINSLLECVEYYVDNKQDGRISPVLERTRHSLQKNAKSMCKPLVEEVPQYPLLEGRGFVEVD